MDACITTNYIRAIHWVRSSNCFSRSIIRKTENGCEGNREEKALTSTNFGKSSVTSMASTQPVLITAIPIFNWKESTYTIMKHLEGNTYHVPSSSIWSQARWTPFARDHLAKYLDQIISCLDSLELVTIGQKVITPKVPNW